MWRSQIMLWFRQRSQNQLWCSLLLQKWRLLKRSKRSVRSRHWNVLDYWQEQTAFDAFDSSKQDNWARSDYGRILHSRQLVFIQQRSDPQKEEDVRSSQWKRKTLVTETNERLLLWIQGSAAWTRWVYLWRRIIYKSIALWPWDL